MKDPAIRSNRMQCLFALIGASIVAACDGFLIPGGQDIDPARYGCQRQIHTHRSATARDEMEDALIRAAVAAAAA